MRLPTLSADGAERMGHTAVEERSRSIVTPATNSSSKESGIWKRVVQSRTARKTRSEEAPPWQAIGADLRIRCHIPQRELGELVTIEGAGHLSNLEAPGSFDDALRELLARCEMGG